jgi:hypothetical protein
MTGQPTRGIRDRKSWKKTVLTILLEDKLDMAAMSKQS